MPTVLDELSARARSLPPQDRARLVEDLLDSLQEGEDVDAQAAWDEEIRRRVAEIEADSVTLVSAEEVHEEAQGLIRR